MATKGKKQITVILSEPSPKTSVVRYDATDKDNAAMTTAYVRKEDIKALGDPAKIKVTIEAA